MDELRDAARDGLPELAGGWSIERYEIAEGAAVRLFVPNEPDALLDDVLVQERNRYNDAMPYWAWVWDSAPLLARQVSAEAVARAAEQVRVLEIGAGLGLVGLGVAAVLGSRGDVLLTDHDADAVRALAPQIRLNGAANVRAEALDWDSPETLGTASFDIVIGCDVIYEARSHAPILELLARVLAPGGIAWFGDPGRTRAPGFVRRAKQEGWELLALDREGVPQGLEAGCYRAFRLERPICPRPRIMR